MRSFIVNTWFVLLDRLGYAVYAFLLLFLLAAFYPPAEVGKYQYALSISIIASILMQLSDDKIVKKFFHSKGVEHTLFSVVALKIALFFSLFFFLSLIFLFGWIPTEIMTLTLLLTVSLGIVGISHSLQAFFDYKSLSEKRALASFLGYTVTFLLQAYLIIFNTPTLECVAVLTIVGSCVTACMLLVFFYNIESVGKIVKSLAYTKEIFLESYPFMLAAVAHIVYMRVDLLMIEHYMSYSSVAFYSVAVQFLALGALLIYPVQVAIFPALAKNGDLLGDKFRFFYYSFTRLSTWIGIVLAALGYFTADLFIEYLYPVEYKVILDFFYIHMLSLVILYNSILRSSYLSLVNLGKILLIAQLTALGLNILLNQFLIPIYGLWGASLATFITICFSLFISNIFYCKSKWIFWTQLKSLIFPVSRDTIRVVKRAVE